MNAATLYRRISAARRAGDGFTINARTGTDAVAGWAVVSPGGPILYGRLGDRLRLWRFCRVAARREGWIGGWLRPDGGYTVDHVVVVPTADAAWALAVLWGQIAVYDLWDGKAVFVTRTGLGEQV